MNRLLLVEDDPEQRSMYALALRMMDCHVDAVADGEDALAYLASNPVDLVLTDWDLPGLNGDDLIVYLHRYYPGTKTILMSSHAHVDEAAHAAHADGWYRKSDSITRLRAVVSGVVCRGNGEL